ncbi:MAG: RsmD family RNA methyltransferase [Chitinivibrionia bacterium]|nr:RsmD family RNA methyltransferase [Chitinivibrionia bacterium]
MVLSVSGGKYKRTQIKIPDNLSDFRPTKAITREAICNILQGKIAGSTVLELCAGSAVFSMEMISRGALNAKAIEKNAALCEFVQKQTKKYQWSEQLEILSGDATDFARGANKKFDIIYFDPPYYKDELNALTKELPTLLNDGGTLIFEFATDDSFAFQIATEMNGNIRKYGKTTVLLLTK